MPRLTVRLDDPSWGGRARSFIRVRAEGNSNDMFDVLVGLSRMLPEMWAARRVQAGMESLFDVRCDFCGDDCVPVTSHERGLPVCHNCAVEDCDDRMWGP